MILDLQDNLTGGLARAAVAAKMLDRELKSMGGTSVSTSRDLDRTATSTDKVGASSRRAGPEVDRMSGRMRIFADAALVLGPALIPIGASAIPVLTAALAGLGAAASGIGVTVLAFKGIGDGLKALDKAQLEPTAENLQALRVEMEKLGPAGAHFARFLDDLEPQMRGLQMVARNGLFPGVEDGITDLMTRLPEVRKIVNRLSQEMGELASEAGASLASDDWTPFFDYLKTEARPTLEAFAHSTGNLALGVANMLVAFAPLNRDFIGGLEEATKAFADWSAGLDENESFQEFLDYVSESGPQVLEFLGALGGALVGLTKAAAPFGTVVLDALTLLGKAFETIADSPIGPGLYAAAAGLIAFNRAASIAEKTSARFSATWAGMSRGSMISGGIGGIGLLAASMTDLDDKVGLANTAMFSMAGLMVGGPWGLAIGAGVGAAVDFKEAQSDLNDELERTREIAESGTMAEKQAEYERLTEAIENSSDSVGGWLLGTQQQEFELANLGDSMGNVSGLAHLFADSVGLTGEQLQMAAASAEDFSGALAELSGWFSKRDAIRGYRDAIDELRESFRDGFTREDAANVDALGQSIIQVANNIKSPKVRNNFLEGAREQLVDMAENSAPKAAAAIQRMINKFDDEGLTHPPVITPTVDPAPAAAGVEKVKRNALNAIEIINNQTATPTIDANANPFLAMHQQVSGDLTRLDKTTADPKVTVDPGNSLGLLAQIKNMLDNIRDKSITVTVNQRGGVTSSAGGQSTDAPSADGGTVPKSGRGYRDRYRYLLADGEEIISNRHGQADRHRSLLKAINAGRKMADGGTTGGHSSWNVGAGTGDIQPAIQFFVAGVWSAAKALNVMKKALEEQQKAYDKAKSARDEAISRRDAISGGIQSGLAADPWAAIEGTAGSVNVWAAGARGGTPGGPATAATATAALQASTARARRLVAAINTLKAKGITGAVLLDIIGSGDVERAEMMASLDLGTLSSFAGAFGENQQALAAAGLAGGNAIEGDNIREWRQQAAAELKELREIKQAIQAAEKAADKAADRNADKVTAGVNGAASNGHRRGR